MSFLSGGVAVQQFKVDCGPEGFDESHVERLMAFATGHSKHRSPDGVEVGWTAGGHLFDTQFTCAKNLRGEFLLFDMRVDIVKLPAALLKAYTELELYALAKDNPSGQPTARQRREAREAALIRLEEEGKDGRFTQRTRIPVVWDVKAGRVWFGSAAHKIVDRFTALFEETFGHALDHIHPGNLDLQTPLTAVTDWVGGVTPTEYAWTDDVADGRWLGNDFLTWLLTECATGSGNTIRTPRGDVVAMVHKSLNLECPQGKTGTAKFAHARPTRMPEVIQALKEGKLPRSAGLILMKDGERYEFTLAADHWAITAGKLPKPEDKPSDRAQAELQRLEAVRLMLETVEDLFLTFTQMRSRPGGMAGVVREFRTWVGLPVGTADLIPITSRGGDPKSVLATSGAHRTDTDPQTGNESTEGYRSDGGVGTWQDGGEGGCHAGRSTTLDREQAAQDELVCKKLIGRQLDEFVQLNQEQHCERALGAECPLPLLHQSVYSSTAGSERCPRAGHA
jgi:hypothetical protein